jgi:hypothetical protein
MAAPHTARQPSRRAANDRRGLAPIAAVVARVARPLLKKRGLAEARLLTEWRAIAGAGTAERSMPERLVRARKGGEGGVLRLRVAGAWALEFQHAAPQLIERINAYFGYPAVAGIRLVQAPLAPRARPRPEPTPLPPADEAALLALTGKIDDPELREQLRRLGRAIRRRTPAPGG